MLITPRRCHYLRVSREREQREILPVEVIHEVEDAREAGSGEIRFIPRSVFLLRAQQVGNASSDRIAAGVVHREQSQDRPGSLRGSTRAHPSGAGIVIRTAGLAPSAIGILHHSQPFGSLLDAGFVKVHADSFQSAQHQCRTIHIIHAPAAEPASVRLLLLADECYGTLARWMALVIAV